VKLSIIIPVLDEAKGLASHLAGLEVFRARGVEVIVVDGGSTDETVEHAKRGADHVLTAPRGRASQMNAGARIARGEVLLFLHADTRPPADADRAIAAAIGQGSLWGRFDVTIEGRHRLLRIIGALMNGRSRLTGIATGDQAIFVTRAAFAAVDGYAQVPLMEDVLLSRALKRLGWPACLRERAITSGRRWERQGVLRTVLSMWRLRLAFFLGADPRRLALAYGYRPGDA
jgi:rSAM/selenodomain-associated transferase 2